jgi:hypothetical protein
MGELSNFLGAFGASGPDPALADRLQLFGQFVGSWDLDVANYDPEGNAMHLEGEWHFGWALAGRAVADVWICPRRTPDGSSPGEHGASIRFYDESLGAWRSTWVGPYRRLVRPFVARGVGDRIVLEGSFEPGVTTRWSFSDIAESTFSWRNEESRDGQTWELAQTFAARRVA